MQDRIKIVVAVDDRGTVSGVYTNREDIIVECAVIDYDLVCRHDDDVVGVDDCGCEYVVMPQTVEHAPPHVVGVHDALRRGETYIDLLRHREEEAE